MRTRVVLPQHLVLRMRNTVESFFPVFQGSDQGKVLSENQYRRKAGLTMALEAHFCGQK